MSNLTATEINAEYPYALVLKDTRLQPDGKMTAASPFPWKDQSCGVFFFFPHKDKHLFQVLVGLSWT